MFKEFNLDNFDNSKEELQKIINRSKQEINKLLKIESKTFENFVQPYEEVGESLNDFITPIFHLDSVSHSEKTEKIYEECLPIISIYETELSQNDNIYRAIKDIQSNFRDVLTPIQVRVLENEIKDFELSGSNLSDELKDELKDLNLELSKLSQEFSLNVLNGTNSFELIVDNLNDIKELPKSDLQIASFKEEGVTKYKFTLQMPSYIPFVTYCTNRKLREEIYKAYATRAPENEEIINRILELKDKKVKILGFSSYSEYSLQRKMATTTQEVISFLEELGEKGKDKAINELKEVKALASIDGITDFDSYDMAYYSQKLKKEQYDVDEEYYRPYFEKDSVLKGFFSFLNEIFNIEFREVETTTWNEKVKVFDIYENDILNSRIYIDLEAREDKRGGAWMNNWHSYYVDKHNKIKLPTAFIVCNFPKSTSTTKSLLRHDDVVTLFHEMGHALHHLLSKVEEPYVSGISGVAWDVVEFPSQFLEYFAYSKDVLRFFAKHHETKELLSEKEIDKIIKAKNFQSSIALVRQVEFALFDFKLYSKLYTNSEDIQSLLNQIRDEYSALIPPAYNKFQHSFSHIFAGGYSAGYYSYKWAEVLSADAFYLFIDSGKILNKDLSLKYKNTILRKGGSQSMKELFYELTNREPKVDSLLKIDGIIS